MSGGLAGGIGDLGGPHSLDQTQISYAGNVAQQAGYLAAGGLGNIAGIGWFIWFAWSSNRHCWCC